MRPGSILPPSPWIIKPQSGWQINPAHPLYQGLAGGWIYNEGGGTKINDLLGVCPATLSGASPYWKSGIFGTSGSFGGSNTSGSLGSKTPLNLTGAMTISAWVKYNSGANFCTIVADCTTAGNDGLFLLFIGQSTGVATWKQNGSFANSSNTGAKKLTAGVWHHVAATRPSNSSSAVISFYVDGVLNGTGTIAAAPGTQKGAFLGSNSASGGNLFNGQIDNTFIWNRALSASEIEMLYTQPYCLMQPAGIAINNNPVVAAETLAWLNRVHLNYDESLPYRQQSQLLPPTITAFNQKGTGGAISEFDISEAPISGSPSFLPTTVEWYTLRHINYDEPSNPQQKNLFTADKSAQQLARTNEWVLPPHKNYSFDEAPQQKNLFRADISPQQGPRTTEWLPLLKKVSTDDLAISNRSLWRPEFTSAAAPVVDALGWVLKPTKITVESIFISNQTVQPWQSVQQGAQDLPWYARSSSIKIDDLIKVNQNSYAWLSPQQAPAVIPGSEWLVVKSKLYPDDPIIVNLPWNQPWNSLQQPAPPPVPVFSSQKTAASGRHRRQPPQDKEPKFDWYEEQEKKRAEFKSFVSKTVNPREIEEIPDIRPLVIDGILKEGYSARPDYDLELLLLLGA